MVATLSIIVVATAEIAGAIVNAQTDRIINELIEGCSTEKSEGGLGLSGTELAFCIERVEKSRDIIGFNVEDCSGQLGLIGEDLTFCETSLAEEGFLINLAVTLRPFTQTFSISNILNQESS